MMGNARNKIKNLSASELEATLTISTLEKLKGHESVSKQFIEDLAKSRHIQQVERDLIREALLTEESVVNVKTFSDKVKGRLLPLERKESLKNGTYEYISLPENIKGEVADYSENIYNSMVKTSAGEIHFQGDENAKNYFGHTRIEDMADDQTRRVVEIQSDLFQKGRLARENIPDIKKDAKITFDRSMDNYKIRLTDESFQYGTKAELREMIDKLSTRPQEISKLQQYNNPTAHFRMVREEIKQAAKDCQTKLQFPTGETAMKIERLGDDSVWGIEGQGELSVKDMSIGLEVQQNFGEHSFFEWIITDVLGDGKFKAVPKRHLEIENDGELWSFAETSDLMTIPDKFGDRQIDLEKALRNEEFLSKYSKRYGETFDISDKVDTSNRIYKFYERDIAKYLKNKHGAQLVTDGQGVTWYEVTIRPEMAIQAVLAFDNADLDRYLSQKKRNDKPSQTSKEIHTIALDKDIQPASRNVYLQGNQIHTMTNRVKQNSMEKETNRSSDVQIEKDRAPFEDLIWSRQLFEKEMRTDASNSKERQALADIQAIRNKGNDKDRDFEMEW